MGRRGDRAATGKSSRSIELGGLVGGAATACRGILSRRCCSVTLVKGTRATIRLRVKAHRDPAVALAAGKTWAVVPRHVPRTAHNIVDMLAPVNVAPSRFAGSDTELIGGLEVGPFMDLLSESLTTGPNI